MRRTLKENINCYLCSFEGKSYHSIYKHRDSDHEGVELAEYIAKMLNIERGKCKCGCYAYTKWNRIKKEYGEYVQGHNSFGSTPWNYGLTKETSESIRNTSIDISESVKKRWTEGCYEHRLTNYSLISIQESSKNSHFKKGQSPWNKGTGHPSPYGNDFNIELKNKIHEKFNNKCDICGSDKNLVVHHIDMNKENNDIENLQLLCRSDHMKVHTSIAKNNLIIHGKDNSIEKFVENVNIKDFDFTLLDYANAKNKIINNHYTHTCPSAKFSFGLIYNRFTCAVIIFSMPSRQNIAESIGYKNGEVLELSRLFIHDGMPKNSGSYLISNALKYIKNNSEYKSIVTYSDSTQGHNGTIYKASNFIPYGEVKENYHYESLDGRRIHKKTIWDRAKRRGISEKEQAVNDNIYKVKEDIKYRFIYKLKAA